jgi:hypothetical protein
LYAKDIPPERMDREGKRYRNMVCSYVKNKRPAGFMVYLKGNSNVILKKRTGAKE